MTKVTFLLLLILLYVLFHFRTNIFGLDDKKDSTAKTIINYIFAGLLILLVVLGFLIAPNTSSTFGKSNAMYDSMSANSQRSSTTAPAKKDDRPHPMFDINTYW